MRSVLTDMQLLNHVTWKRIRIGFFRHVVVERGVADDNIAHFGEHLATNLNDVGFGIVVKRSQRRNFTDPTKCLIGNDGRLREVPASLNNAVTNAVNGLIHGFQNVKNVLDSRFVIGKRHLKLLLLAAHFFMTYK